MNSQAEGSKVDIRPGVKIYSVLRHLNYKTWFAIAEFVDNSIQSFQDCQADIQSVEKSPPKLRVEIELETTDGGRLIIRDNAGGIRQEDFPRAFRPAAIPPDRSGLSEFGMGMKSAACWFSPKWSVRTSVVNEPLQRIISFDIDHIVDDEIEELDIAVRPSTSDSHFTEIILTDLHRVPQTSNIGKIKKHLSSIYREFLRDGTLELHYNGERLEFSEVDVLVEPIWSPEPAGEPLRWYKPINFDFGLGLRVHGFAALRAVASTFEAGFALFRRRRVIEGSGDETYRPYYIFGSVNSFRHQRVFGELHLEGFEVSHTKDGFEWNANEQPFLELLREELDAEPLPLLKQAERYRPRQKTRDIKKDAQNSTESVASAVAKAAPQVLERQLAASPDTNEPLENLTPTAELAAQKVVFIEVFDKKWEILLELTNDPAIGDWVSYYEIKAENLAVRKVGIRLTLSHPFMTQFGVTDATRIEPLQRLAVAIVLSEITARESGVKAAGTLRHNINEFLLEAFAAR